LVAAGTGRGAQLVIDAAQHWSHDQLGGSAATSAWRYSRSTCASRLRESLAQPPQVVTDRVGDTGREPAIVVVVPATIEAFLLASCLTLRG
jgi:hypothetical protein